MTLAKCAKCGETLIAPEDGQPHWCTQCSIEMDQEDHDFEVHCMQMAAMGDERYI
jgi:hypothetical protein